ncbi:Nudix (nucleoside diphosphate linked moiety X)-type motif 17 [Balamuthia mandrillaris]
MQQAAQAHPAATRSAATSSTARPPPPQLVHVQAAAGVAPTETELFVEEQKDGRRGGCRAVCFNECLHELLSSAEGHRQQQTSKEGEKEGREEYGFPFPWLWVDLFEGPDQKLYLLPSAQCKRQQPQLTDSLQPLKEVRRVPLGHAPDCPVKMAKATLALSSQQKNKEVLVGVVVLIETTEENGQAKVLLTKRLPTTSLFPSLWVLPGGHTEKGETLSQTGVREVFEETGVSIPEEDVTPFGLWESVYPSTLEEGPPTRHHLVVFYRARLPMAAHEVHLQLQPEEVAAAAWLDRATLKRWFSRQHGFTLEEEKNEREIEEEVEAQLLALHPCYSADERVKLEAVEVELAEQIMAMGHVFILHRWLLS